MGTFLVILLVLLILFVIIGQQGLAKQNRLKKEQPEKFAALEAIKIIPKIKAEYFLGHPSINTSKWVYIFRDGDVLQLVELRYGLAVEDPTPIASIPIDAIKNVSTEDQTSIERKVTAGRLLLTGPLALAWKKKKVHEAAYLKIDWNAGKFNNETLFRKEGAGSLNDMNTARNMVIKWTDDYIESL